MSDRLTAERLREVLFYDKETGLFTWLVTLSTKCPAGSVSGKGNRSNRYVYIKIDGRSYFAHRLAWLYVKGVWPTNQIDHRNTDSRDNRWDNLREATPSQNSSNTGLRSNNTSGLKGASWSSKANKWSGWIRIRGTAKWLGYFDTAEEAHAAYRKAADGLFGEFANYGVVQ